MLSTPRYRQIWKTAILPVVDFVSIFIGMWVVYFARYYWFEDRFNELNALDRIPIAEYFFISLGVSLSIVVIYTFIGLYQISASKKPWQLVINLAIGIALVLLGVITFFFFNEYNRETLPEGVPISRFILATAGFVTLYFVLLSRALIWAFEQIAYYFGLGKIDILIIGDKKSFLKNKISQNSYIGKILQYPQLSKDNFEEIKQKIVSKEVSEIYIFGSKGKIDSNLAAYAERYKVGFIFSPEGFSDFQSFGLKPIIIDKKVFLELTHSNLDGWQVVLKRVFDIIFSILFLTIFSWLYLLIAIVIKIDSKGPAFYQSERVGPDGKVFKVLKFRRLKIEYCTSEEDFEKLKIEEELIKKRNLKKDSVLYKIKDDPRATKVGRFLEKTSLDELPQFWNVLKGDLSLVGPRPHQPREVAKYQNHHYKVLNIQPGLTGLAQVNGRSDLSFEEEVVLDTFYLENWSFWMDILIILKTPFVIIFDRHQG